MRCWAGVSGFELTATVARQLRTGCFERRGSGDRSRAPVEVTVDRGTTHLRGVDVVLRDEADAYAGGRGGETLWVARFALFRKE